MICENCQANRPLKQFSPDARTVQGRGAWCKPCKKALQKAFVRIRRQETKTEGRDKVARATWYGLTEADYHDMLDLQGGGCAGCGRLPKEERRFSIDHRHQPGDKKREPWERALMVRGILCWPCNKLLGVVRDNAETLKKLSAYLENPPADTVVKPRLEIVFSKIK